MNRWSSLHARAVARLTLPAILIVAVTCAAASATAATAIVTDQGPLKGIVSNVNEYLGIPYAAPPTGKRRWLPTQPPAKFTGVFQATAFGNKCPQLLLPPFGSGAPFGDEDCLSLNVYVPSGAPPAHGFPVMFWIHGGSLTSGTGSDFDPVSLVQKGAVIVVTINYRLGALGFLAQGALDSEGHAAGNYGLMDQQQALKWVRKNIGVFGGDRNRVTIFGQSSGGDSVMYNLASPTAAGLFQRAIAESQAVGFQDYLEFVIPLAAAEAGGNALAAAVGCASQSAQCLRAVPADLLVASEPQSQNGFVDGVFLTRSGNPPTI